MNENKQLLVNLLAKYSIIEFITGLYLSIEANDDVIKTSVYFRTIESVFDFTCVRYI